MVSVSLPLHGVGEPRPDVATLSAMHDHAVSTMPDAIAMRQRGKALTFRDEGRMVRALARRLAERTGPGDAVALLLPNAMAFRVAYFAALRALTTPALLNPLYPQFQLEPLLRAVAPRLIICAPETRDLVATLSQHLGVADAICLGEGGAGMIGLDALAAEPDATLDRPPAKPQSVAALMFTGGTTGLSKIVEHTHERLIVAVRCVEYKWPTRASGEVWLPIAPFTHVYGFLQGLLCPVSARAELIIPDRFQPEHVVDLLTRHRVTVFGGGPPAIYAGLLAAGNLAGADLSALRVCPAGGAPMPVELMERWRRITGCTIYEGYGMTEMAPISGTSDLSGVRPGSVGPAIPCNTIEIVDVETGTRVLAPGERGEVRVRGPHMMKGYRDQPEETARTLRDGFIHTGDIGHLDEDGFLFITDRKKDVVLVKGFNVFPREVEEVIHAYPGAEAVGVVGAPDPRSGGEKLVAFVVPRAGQHVDGAAIAAHCAERLVVYQRPAEVRVVDRLPMTGAQKLDRLALRRMAAE